MNKKGFIIILFLLSSIALVYATPYTKKLTDAITTTVSTGLSKCIGLYENISTTLSTDLSKSTGLFENISTFFIGLRSTTVKSIIDSITTTFASSILYTYNQPFTNYITTTLTTSIIIISSTVVTPQILIPFNLVPSSYVKPNFTLYIIVSILLVVFILYSVKSRIG